MDGEIIIGINYSSRRNKMPASHSYSSSYGIIWRMGSSISGKVTFARESMRITFPTPQPYPATNDNSCKGVLCRTVPVRNGSGDA